MTDKTLRAGDYLGHMLDAISQIHTYTAGLDETSFRASFRMPWCAISRSSGRRLGTF
jgi:uncharacterized protein with HEPN domain